MLLLAGLSGVLPQASAAPRSVPTLAQLSSQRNGICGSPCSLEASTSGRACSGAQLTVECKLKTLKAAAKRFRVTGGGKVVARRPGKQHINEKKSPNRLRKLGKMQVLEKGDKDNVKQCLPYAGIK